METESYQHSRTTAQLEQRMAEHQLSGRYNGTKQQRTKWNFNEQNWMKNRMNRNDIKTNA